MLNKRLKFFKGIDIVLKKILCILIVSFILAHPIKAQNGFAETNRNMLLPADDEVCALAAIRMEAKYGIRDHLLETISSVESGIWNQEKQAFTAWPWSINVHGKGYRFDTKQQAVEEVKRLQAQGIKSIDVGCMQISLKYHANSFETLEDAFDPDKNTEYSAQFLTALYAKTGDWQKAAMAYHSKVKDHAALYKNRLLKRFEKIKIAFLDLNSNLSLF